MSHCTPVQFDDEDYDALTRAFYLLLNGDGVGLLILLNDLGDADASLRCEAAIALTDALHVLNKRVVKMVQQVATRQLASEENGNVTAALVALVHCCHKEG